MLNIKYKISLDNPVSDKMKPSDTYLEHATLEIFEVDTGFVIKGFYKKNKEVIVASSNSFIGEDFHLKSGDGNKTYLESSQTFLDVERVLKASGKNLKDLDSEIRNNINVASYTTNSVYKLRHILANKEDAVFFKLEGDGTLTSIPVAFSEPSNLITYAEQDAFILYFLVNKTLKVSPYKDFYLNLKDLESLPQGFCTLSNELLLSNKISLESTSTNNYILKGINPTKLSSTFPIKFDNVKLIEYQTTPKEILLLSVDTDNTTSLASFPLTLTDNITAIYEIQADGTLSPYLLLYTDGLLNVPSSALISSAFSDRINVLKSDSEFKKNYTVRQYKIKLRDSNTKVYSLYDESFYNSILHDITKFNKKIVKNDN